MCPAVHLCKSPGCGAAQWMCSLGNKADLTSSSGCRMKRQGLTRDMYGKKTETELQRACGLGPGDEEKQIRGRNRLEAPEVQPETLTRPPRAGAKWRVRRAEPDAEVLLLVGGRRKAVRDRFALQGGTGDFP